jgi:hypothetical protein
MTLIYQDRTEILKRLFFEVQIEAGLPPSMPACPSNLKNGFAIAAVREYPVMKRNDSHG